MVYNIEEIKKEVRVILDKNLSSTPLIDIGDIDSLTIDEVIESKIADAVRAVHSNAPAYMLDKGKPFADSIGWDAGKGTGSGYVPLPDDFLRLISFQMTDWLVPVTEAITEEDPKYAMQKSRFAGIKGNPEKPVVAIAKWPIGLVLEFFSCTGGETVAVKRARYISIPKIMKAEGGIKQIEICEKLKAAALYYCAYLSAVTLGIDTAEELKNISNKLIE